MQIICYSSDLSITSQIVRLCLEEFQIDYKNVNIDVNDLENFDKWYVRMNNFMTTPTLQWGKFLITKDIVQFLSEKLQKNHKEKNLKLVEYLTSFKNDIPSLYKNIMKNENLFKIFIIKSKKINEQKRLKILMKDNEFYDIVQKKIQKTQKNYEQKNQIQACQNNLSENLLMLNNMLKNDFLINDNYSVADAVLTCLLARIIMVQGDERCLQNYKSLQIYWQKVKKRQSFSKANVLYKYEDSQEYQKYQSFKKMVKFGILFTMILFTIGIAQAIQKYL